MHNITYRFLFLLFENQVFKNEGLISPNLVS